VVEKMIHTKVVTCKGAGYAPVRVEVVVYDGIVVVRKCGWLGDRWEPMYPAVWTANYNVLSFTSAKGMMRKSFEDHIHGLIMCDYEFSVTNEPIEG
jgi:hypothetical protein